MCLTTDRPSLIIKRDPSALDENDPIKACIKEDYVSCADQRASLPPIGWGFPVLLTFKGLVIDNFPKSPSKNTIDS